MPRFPKTLPARYYLDHFFEFLAFFDGANGELLNRQASQFIADFRALDDNQQCIIVRAANRKYALINRDHFVYEEINHQQDHIDALIASGWFGGISEAPVADIIATLPKADLLTLLGLFEDCRGLTSAKKADIGERLAAIVRQQGWPQHADLLPQYWYCRFEPALQYLLFLYFGHNRGRLNQFSMRDLGVMRTRKDATSDSARFTKREDAELAFFYANQLSLLAHWSDAEVLHAGKQAYTVSENPQTERARDRFLYKLGLRLLPLAPELALSVLAQAPGDSAREKWLREAYKAGSKDQVKSELEAIIDNPASDSLLAFAEDFYARKYHKKRTSAVTDMLRNASRSLALDESHNMAVEEGVIAHYRRDGIAAWRTENTLWRRLFGLTFWALLFEQDSLVTEFDRRPQSLRNNCVYATFSTDIDHLLASLDTPSVFMQHVTAMATKHYGKVNSLFMWSTAMLEPVKVLLEHAELNAIKQLLAWMCEDFRQLSDGFPDIMVITDKGLHFEEIKAPGDQLRRNQLVSIQRMLQAGISVHITQVSWCRDPLQPYAVVDIETTGGQSAYHRITEVGIAKVINGEVVDSWQSLINPHRHIPAAITRLTGISNDMVADAPGFAEVADAIDAFTQDCVFVAHNVNFDYGFIKQEFARLERPYRRPKLCTVREMRKAYPGLESYSLAALTKHFDITMTRHHRALSDAEAAAQLLLLSQQVSQ